MAPDTAAPWCPRCNHRIGGDKPCPHGVRPTTTAARHVPDGDGGYECLCENAECCPEDADHE